MKAKKGRKKERKNDIITDKKKEKRIKVERQKTEREE